MCQTGGESDSLGPVRGCGPEALSEPGQRKESAKQRENETEVEEKKPARILDLPGLTVERTLLSRELGG